MGLQDTPQMSAVPAHDVIKTASSSARSRTASSDHALEESLLALTLKGGSYRDQEEMSNNSEADDMDYQHELDGLYEDDDEDWEWETDDNRLSRALRTWMSDYVITPLPPQTHTKHEPIFSARLGHERNIHRAPSCDSIDTQLSLFSCSSYGSRKRRERKRRRLRKKKTASAESGGRKPPSRDTGSRWESLARRRKGELDRFMMAQSHALTQGVNLTDESEAFQMCEADEQRALYDCGHLDKVTFAAELKKSDSMTNIKDVFRGKRRQRVVSAGTRTFYGKAIDFQELQRQMMNQKLAALNAPRRTSGRRSTHRTHSRLSITSAGSGDHAFFSAPRTPVGGPETPLPPSSSSTPEGREPVPQEKEKSVNMWKGDAQILAIDLQRELTTKVKRRIAGTTTALERVTGVGDDNEQRPYTATLPDFPAYIEDDFAFRPKIPQRICIAPQLSDVIKNDIKVRMGRPRYHEIRIRDLEVWNRGQNLDRTHRNLKVFNWLHSLKEDDFEEASLQQTIDDVPPDVEDVTFGDMILIRAADEPDIKPLYEQKTYIR